VSPIDIDRGEAWRRAVRELVRPEYEHEALPDRIMRYVQQFFADLLNATGGGLAGGVIAAIVIVLVLGVLAGLLVWQAGRASRARATPVGEVLGGRARSAAEHRAEAERLAAQERWAEAVRERLRAVARDLEERALVGAQPGRTADELAAEAARSFPALAAELTTAARIFDDITYGEVPGTAAAYASLRDLDDRLRSTAPALAGGGAVVTRR
jgi:hypothetical protein